MKKSWTQMSFGLVALVLLLLGVVGCDSGGGSDDSSSDGDANAFIGTWSITKEGTASYWTFNDNGTFRKNRAGEPVNGGLHFTGTYTVKFGALQGEFTNPGVGKGEIKAQIGQDGRMRMDFIEFWHSPAKVVPCIGIRK